MLVAVLAGVVSFASPCCLPMIPVYVSYLLGTTSPPQAVPQRVPEAVGQRAPQTVPQGAPQDAGQRDVPASGRSRGRAAVGAGGLVTEPGPAGASRTRNRRTALSHSLVFVAGFSTVFVSLWASVGLVGYVLRDYVGILRVAGGIMLILFGLHLAGLVEISVLYRQAQVPARRVMGGPPVDADRHHARYGRSLLLGVIFAAGWTPCVGPILGGIIGLASVSSSVGAGSVLLICYALGLGIPFVLVALGVEEVGRRLRWLSRHHVGVGLVTGAALIVTGFLMITNLFMRLSGVLPAVGL